MKVSVNLYNDESVYTDGVAQRKATHEYPYDTSTFDLAGSSFMA